jgi:ribosomal protein S27AE
MTERKCPECGSEVVLARHPDSQPGAPIEARPSTYWRCSTCGGGFTAEQVRPGKPAKALGSLA